MDLIQLDVVGRPTDPLVKDGLLPPRLTGDQLKSKDSVYGIDQSAVMVYVTTAVGVASSKTINVISQGYYFMML